MTCEDRYLLKNYLDGELSPEGMRQVAMHLDQCKVCQQYLDSLIALNEWEEDTIHLKQQEPLVNIDKGWNTLSNTLANQKIISLQTKKYTTKGAFNEMNKMKKWMTIAAASVLAVTAVPVVAVGVYNLFSSHVLEDGVVNEGMMREDGTMVDGTKNGSFQPLDLKITDKGITVHLTELYVADSRVSVHYRIEDESGALIPVSYDTEGRDIKDDGIQSSTTMPFLGCEDNLPFELMKDGEKIEIGIRELGEPNEGTITFAGFESVDYPAVIDIQINQIGTVEGSWTGQVTIEQ